MLSQVLPCVPPLGQSWTGIEQRQPPLVLAYVGRFLHGLSLLSLRGFDTSLEALLPECCGVLMTDTGYLTPTDLDEFDKVGDG